MLSLGQTPPESKVTSAIPATADTQIQFFDTGIQIEAHQQHRIGCVAMPVPKRKSALDPIISLYLLTDVRFVGRRSLRLVSKEANEVLVSNTVNDEDHARAAESEDNDFDSQAVDLARILDTSGDDSDDAFPQGGSEGDSESASAAEDSETDEGSVLSISDVGEEQNDPAKLSALRDLIDSVQEEPSGRPTKRQRFSNAHDPPPLSGLGVDSRKKLTVDDLLSTVTDADLRKSLRLMSSAKNSRISIRRDGIPGKLEPPVPKRQQDKADRAAAYEKSKKTLERWIDTIKHNRQAEHLSFPLVDRTAAVVQNNRQAIPSVRSTPINNLEATIENILVESGLSTRDGRTDEQKLQELEELQTNKMPLEEVQARRAQLQMARELLFREEVRAKRVKKIKSKAYRRVHRREREKAEQENRSALAAGGYYDSEEEREKNDRRRAEERMGARHRESKWAKAMKATGRARWDEEARLGVVEMANREEDLKRRIEGKTTTRNEDGDLTSSSSDDEGDDELPNDDIKDRLLSQLDERDDGPVLDGEGPPILNRLSSMKFMQRANAAKKAENDAAVRQLKRDLAVDESSSEEEAFAIGRRIYKPKAAQDPGRDRHDKMKLNEFEENFSSEDEPDRRQVAVDPELAVDLEHEATPPPVSLQKPSLIKRDLTAKQNGHPKTDSVQASRKDHRAAAVVDDPKAPMQISKNASNPSKPKAANSTIPREAGPQSNPATWTSIPAPQMTTTSVLNNEDNFSSDSESEAKKLTITAYPSQDELRQRAFAGDDDEVAKAFEAEKTELADAEGDQTIDNALPGWGHWIGSGVDSKRSKKKNKKRSSRAAPPNRNTNTTNVTTTDAAKNNKNTTLIPGTKQSARKDRRLPRVIISEKRPKKNSAYLAPALPHPFETKQQYERSLRLPLGPEWTTKETFQDATKPRLLVKQGVIAPMENPFL